MATEDDNSWITTSAFVSTTTRETTTLGVASVANGYATSVVGNIKSDVIAVASSKVHRDEKFFNSTASALLAAVDVTWLSVSTSGSDVDDEIAPGLLWLPYVVFTIVLFTLIALSFCRFHCQRGHQYRRRQAELSDKRPYRQLQQPTPDHFQLLGSETGSASGGQPNGGLSSSGGGYMPEQMNLFVQYSQVLPDDCYFNGVDENAAMRSIKKNGSAGKRGGLNRRPLVFTFNSNGSMVDIRCDEEERTNTFRLVPNADSAGGDEPEVQEIDLGNGDLEDIEPSLTVPLTPLSSSYSGRQLPVQYHSSIDIEPYRNYSLNTIPPPPSHGVVANRAVMTSSGGGSNCSSSVNGGRERTAAGARHNSSNYIAAGGKTAQIHSSAAMRLPDQNHLSPPALTELSTAVPDSHRQRLTPPVLASCSSPPPRPLSPSTLSTHRSPLPNQQRLHHKQTARCSPTPPRHPQRHPNTHAHHHRLSSSSAASNFRPNHHPHHTSNHRTVHNSHRPGTHYAPLEGSDRGRKDLYASDEEDSGLNCAAEALLLWQKRV